MEKIGANGLKLLSELLRRPLVNVNHVVGILKVTFPTANRPVAGFEELGLLRGARPTLPLRRVSPLRLFDEPSSDGPGGPSQVTEARGKRRTHESPVS